MRAVRAELFKLSSLPSAWVACLAGILVPSGIAVLTSSTATPGVDTGYQELSVGVLGAVVIGVIAIGSEYSTEGEEAADGRQITTTLITIPSRLRLLMAKIIAVVLASGALAIVAAGSVFGVLHWRLGAEAPVLDADGLWRMVGVALYWVLTALLGFGLTVLTRNGIIPMAVLIANSSAVTVTYLLTKLTPLANFLPDMAGMRMFSRGLDTGVVLTPVVGGLVMTAWVVALLALAGAVFARRDA